MYDQSEAETARRLQPAHDANERHADNARREADPRKLRPAEEPADGAHPQGVVWRWHVRRRRPR